MRRLVLLAATSALLATSACAPPEAQVAVAAPIAPPAAKPAPPPPSAAQCRTPQADRTTYERSHLDDLFFGTCDDFEKSFYADMSAACAEAAPDLAKALDAAADPDPAAAPPDPHGPWTKSSRRSAILFDAAKGHLSTMCLDGDAKISLDDWTRGAFERPGRAWRDVPECRPDPELFRMATDADRLTVFYGYGRVDFAHHLFALALRPHLSPVGTQYLRKFLFCSQLRGEEGHKWDRRLRSEGPRKEYLLDPDPEVVPEP